jgi:hypothetical protein
MVTWLICASFKAFVRKKRLGKSLNDVGEWKSLPKQLNRFVAPTPVTVGVRTIRSDRGLRRASSRAPKPRITARRRNRPSSLPSVDQSYSYGLFSCESWTTNTHEEI